MEREHKLLIIIAIIAFVISLGAIAAYESSVDDSISNMISQSVGGESYTKFHNLEFKVPKGFNVTKNNSNDVIMTTKDVYFKNYTSSYTGFDLPKNKGVSAISIAYISVNNTYSLNSNNSDINSSNSTNSNDGNSSNSNNSSNNDINSSISNGTETTDLNNSVSSSNLNNTGIGNNSDTSNSNNDKIDFSKISIQNPSNNFTVDGVTVFRMSKGIGVKSYIFSYKNGIYAVSFYSANSTNTSVTDEMFKSITDKTFN